jgi:hypothetical protein
MASLTSFSARRFPKALFKEPQRTCVVKHDETDGSVAMKAEKKVAGNTSRHLQYCYAVRNAISRVLLL